MLPEQLFHIPRTSTRLRPVYWVRHRIQDMQQILNSNPAGMANMYRGSVHLLQNSSCFHGPLNQIPRHWPHWSYYVCPKWTRGKARNLGLIAWYSAVYLLMSNRKASCCQRKLERVATAEIECDKIVKWNVEEVWDGFDANTILEYPVCRLVCPVGWVKDIRRQPESFSFVLLLQIMPIVLLDLTEIT